MLPDYYEFICPVKILSGRKALSNIPYEFTQMGAKRPLVITDKGVAGAKLIEPVRRVFADGNMEFGAYFDETPVDSGAKVVNQLARLYQMEKCDSILAIGGGSVLDTAKGVNIVVSEKEDDLLKLQGVDRITARMQPFIAVPTTAGTGSEVTSAAVIANEDAGVKMAFISAKLFPHVAVLDPKMTMTMPPKITAASGMDALTHAIEAYYCLQKNPVSDAYAHGAITLTMKYLVKAVHDGANEEARMGMANAALLAGMSFSNSMVGMVHALAHACGGVAHVPHGIANSILLPFGMAYNIRRVPEFLAELAPLLGVQEKGRNAEETARLAVEAVRSLTKKLNSICKLPLTLKDAGVKEDQLEDIARVSINDGALTYNPEEMTYEDALHVLKDAF